MAQQIKEKAKKYNISFYPIIDTFLNTQHKNLEIEGMFRLGEADTWTFIMLNRDIKMNEPITIFNGLGVAIHPTRFNYDEREYHMRPNVVIIESNPSRYRKEIRKIYGEVDKLFTSEIFNTLGSGVIDIVSGIYYWFRLRISERNVIYFKVWRSGIPEPPDSDYNRIISVPYANPEVKGKYFGIGVFNTKGTEFLINNLTVNKIGLQRDYLLFEFDGADLKPGYITLEFSAGARSISIGKIVYGVEVYIYNGKEGRWEFLTENNKSFEEALLKLRHRFFLKREYFEYLGKLYLLITPKSYYPSTEIEWGLEINHIKLIIEPEYFVPTYGTCDVYVFEDEILTEKFISSNPGYFRIYYPDPVPVSRILEIVAIMPDGREIIIPPTAYKIETINPYFRWSKREVIQVNILDEIYHDLDLKVRYTYFNRIADLQNIIENTDKRIVFADTLLFQFIPYYLDLTFNYKGDITPEELENKLYDFIRKQNILKLSDIIDFCYNNNVNYIDLNSLKAKLIHYTRHWEEKIEEITNFKQLNKNERIILLRPSNIRRIF